MKDEIVLSSKIKKNKELSQHLCSITAVIAETLGDDLISQLNHVKQLKAGLGLTIDMFIQDQEEFYDVDINAASDHKTLKEIKQAIESGMLVHVSVLIGDIKDELTKEMLFGDFKEVSSFLTKSETLIAKMEKGHILEMSNRLDYVNQDGMFSFKNIDNFDPNSFEKVYEHVKTIKLEPKQDTVQSNTLPEFEETSNTMKI